MIYIQPVRLFASLISGQPGEFQYQEQRIELINQIEPEWWINQSRRISKYIKVKYTMYPTITGLKCIKEGGVSANIMAKFLTSTNSQNEDIKSEHLGLHAHPATGRNPERWLWKNL